MASPTPAYSVRLRVEVDNTPGSLGRLATAIGEAGGNIAALDIVEATAASVIEDVTVDARDEGHAAAIRTAVEALDRVHVHSVLDRTFLLHVGGKIEVRSKIPLRDRADLSMAYTPGVARVCNAIAADPEQVHTLTIKRNTVAIVTDGTAVLGLGDIGPEAALPVMEGKALLFKEFAGVDAFPLCLATTDVDEIVALVKAVAPTFGGVNLEDIAAPRCFEIERRLRAELDIPVFHDDQHGTAIVVLALSGPGAVSPAGVRTMAADAIVFAMANPVPEVHPEEVRDDVAIMATGRSDYPNQINNVLAFPGVFRGALDARASTIDEAMKLAAAEAIAACVPQPARDCVIPSVFEESVA